MPIKETLDLEISPQLDRTIYERQLRDFKRRTERILQSTKPVGQAGLLETIFMPQGGRANRAIKKNMGKQFQEVSKQMGTGLKGSAKQGRDIKGMSSDFTKVAINIAKATGMVKIFTQELRRAADEMRKAKKEAEQATKEAGGGTAGGGKGEKGGSGGRFGRIKRYMAGAAAFVGGSLLGFMTGAYREGISNYQQRSQDRLEQAPYMMGFSGYGKEGARFTRGGWASGADLGYNASQAAQIQGRAAKLGLGGGPMAARVAMTLERGYGEGGVDIASGLARRTGGTATQAMKTMSQAMAVGIKTGLDEARIGEFLSAANDYAERQLAVTPDKDTFKQFYKELAFLQERGGKGLAGKYGAAALGRVDQSIKGASGASQALMFRAFGFGQGKSFFDVLKQQEQGIAGKGNISAIMKQLQKEYGVGEGGGLSQSGMIAFKNMGMGSLGMAKKFSDVYMQEQKGVISTDEAHKKVKDIEEKEKLAKVPLLQRKAWAGMANFGKMTQMMASRFDRMADFGAKNIKIMETVHKLQEGMVKMIEPIMGVIKDSLPTFLNLMTTVMSVISEGIKMAVRGIMYIVKFIQGFSKGWKESKNTGFTQIFKRFGDAFTTAGDTILQQAVDFRKMEEKLENLGKKKEKPLSPEMQKEMSKMKPITGTFMDGLGKKKERPKDNSSPIIDLTTVQQAASRLLDKLGGGIHVHSTVEIKQDPKATPSGTNKRIKKVQASSKGEVKKGRWI